MTLGNYIVMVGNRIIEAEEREDKDEILRLSNLLRETVGDTILKLEKRNKV